MSLFDDDDEDFYYDPNNDFQRRALKHAEQNDTHALIYIAKTMGQALDAFDEFSQQDPLMSKRERMAIESDVEEARDALERAAEVIPQEVVEDKE